MIAMGGRWIEGGDQPTKTINHFLCTQWSLRHICHRSSAFDGLPELFLSLVVELGVLAASNGLKVSIGSRLFQVSHASLS